MNKRSIVAGLMCLLVAPTAKADSISVSVDAPFEPVSAVGIIVNETTTIQKTEATFTRGRDDQVVVTFPYRDSEIGSGAAVTAMIIAEDGTMAFGEMRPLESQEHRVATGELPDCPAEKIATAGLESQMGLLQKLLDVRTARRANVQQQLKEILDPEFRTKLAKLEKGFGLSRSTSISATLSPLELHERLTRIIAALNDYRGAKKRADDAQNAAAEAAAQKSAANEAAPQSEELDPPADAGAEAAPPNVSEEGFAGN